MNQHHRRGEFNVLCTFVMRVAEFADREYQTRVCIDGEGTNITSYSEAMLVVLEDASKMFSDLAFRYGLNDEQVNALRTFRDRLEKFQRKIPTSWDGDDLVIVSDPEWPEIVSLASQATSLCKNWSEQNCDKWGLSLANFDLPIGVRSAARPNWVWH